ncbi:MAG: hypothetical protein A2048_03555 [Deltaproteobacteria bacterium GWA2_45_12]|nr:MAG: hypothetical protein A2048_03555 [Deltaproteobacteria bacterium GWA2_45_12]
MVSLVEPCTAMCFKTSRIFTLLATGIVLVSCASSKTKNENALHLTLATEPPTLDWNLANDNVSHQVINQIMEGLAEYDENMNPVPAIAETWDVSKDGLVYTFHLKKNHAWTDGKPVTANDFRDSWLRLLAPKTASEYAYFLYDIVGAREFNTGQILDAEKVGIKTVDDHTLLVTLTQPIVYFPHLTTFMVTYPIRVDVVDRYGPKWTEPRNIVTCGPYQLTEWWHEYRLSLRKNPSYAGLPKPFVDEIIFNIVPDPSTALTLYDQAMIDVAVLPPMAIGHYKNSPDFVHHSRLRNTYFGFNITKPPFDNVFFRRALSQSLDKSQIPSILNGKEIPIKSWIPSNLPTASPEAGLGFNPDLASLDLEKSKVDLSQPIELYFNSDPTNKKLAEWAQNQWKQNLGLNVELINQDWKSYLSLLHNDAPGLFRLGWGADYPDADSFMNVFLSYSGNNFTQWKNKTFDALVIQARGEANVEKRKNIYTQAEKMLLDEEAIIIPLYQHTQNMVVKKKWQPYPTSSLDAVYLKRVRAIHELPLHEPLNP